MTSKEISSETFGLLKWFAILSFVSITIISAVSAYALYRYVAAHLTERDAVVSMEFIQSVSQINYLADQGQTREFFEHVSRIPDVLRATIYGADESIVWSSDPELIGKRFEDNPELKRALSGELVFQHETLGDHVDNDEYTKSERVFMPPESEDFIESYIPVWDKSKTRVIGAVELYKSPTALFMALADGRRLVILISFIGGLLLYGTLFWIVKRGSSIINNQHKALIESDRLATIGSLAASVAHSIRNPIASIRSSAELSLDEVTPEVRESLQDIITETDQFDSWIKELLTFSQGSADTKYNVSIPEMLGETAQHYSGQLKQSRIEMRINADQYDREVIAEPHLLRQVFNSLFANSIEAMPHGGLLTVSSSTSNGMVTVEISDTGVGISEQDLGDVLSPLVSYKPNGLGLGLALAKRSIEQFGGKLELSSTFGSGTTAKITLPSAA